MSTMHNLQFILLKICTIKRYNILSFQIPSDAKNVLVLLTCVRVFFCLPENNFSTRQPAPTFKSSIFSKSILYLVGKNYRISKRDQFHFAHNFRQRFPLYIQLSLIFFCRVGPFLSDSITQSLFSIFRKKIPIGSNGVIRRLLFLFVISPLPTTTHPLKHFIAFNVARFKFVLKNRDTTSSPSGFNDSVLPFE